jgi:tryptophanyl-tRNA synthetase
LDFDAQPGISNLLQILALLSNKPVSEVAAKWEGKTNYAELKTAVAEAIKQFLTDFQAKLGSVDEQAINVKLTKDEAQMNTVATSALEKVQKAVGLRP